jgi:hypothetical protein
LTTAVHFIKFNCPYAYVKVRVNSTITGVTDVTTKSEFSPEILGDANVLISDGVNNLGVNASSTATANTATSITVQESPNSMLNASAMIVIPASNALSTNLFNTTANTTTVTDLSVLGVFPNTVKPATFKSFTSSIT